MSSESESSYRKIHYLLRPAKNVQRKMLSEAFQRLNLLNPLRDYRYIGFGSMYYGDFVLFHRALGMEYMTSIEHEKGAERAAFNKPYNCVEVLPGRANTKLVEVKWKERPAIIWLDYDYGLDQEVLNDVGLVAANALPESVIVVTLDATEKGLKQAPDEPSYPFDEEAFEETSLIGKFNLKCGTELPEDTPIGGGKLSELYRAFIANRIQKEINSLVAPRSGQPDVEYRQIFNFRYSDGREMMTVGGVLAGVDASRKSTFSNYRFTDFTFFRPGEVIFEIEAPKLTLREVRELNRGLPCSRPEDIQVPIPAEDKVLYNKIYRYFPTFTEAEL